MPNQHKPPLALIGGIARSGNHLLRGLLDGLAALTVPPDDDFFVRTLTRSRSNLWRAWFCAKRNAPAFFRRMQKDGNFERLNSGPTENFPSGTNLIDLDAYYATVRRIHSPFSLHRVCEAHFQGLRLALPYSRVQSDPMRVLLCPFAPLENDFGNICWLLSKYYNVYAIVMYRNPLATYVSGHRRGYFGDVAPFLRSIDMFPDQVEQAANQYGVRVLTIAFEDLVTETEKSMRRLSDFLKITFDPFMLAYTQNGLALECNSLFEINRSVDPKRATLLSADIQACGLSLDELDSFNQRGSVYINAMRQRSQALTTSEI